MRSVAIGTPVALRSSRADNDGWRAGFTLLEALVALALVLAFASALGPYRFHSRRIMVDAESRLAAQVLLRTLLDAPFDRTSMANASREGEVGKLRWRIVSEPLVTAATPPRDRPNWSAFRIVASVAWGPEQAVTAETVRLGKPE
jgi:prepilin-type N-terminal cleavage/methylation domain-containing protein